MPGHSASGGTGNELDGDVARLEALTKRTPEVGETTNSKTTEVGVASHLLSQFPQDEQDDFSAVCQKYGRDVSEFEVVDEDQYPAGGRVGPIGRQVTVALRGRSTVAQYDGGQGRAWIADFENDLKSGSFD